MKVQQTVKDETKRVAIGEGIGVAIMLAIWLVIHLCTPSVPFDFLIVGLAAAGGFVAVLNFFLLGLFVQKATGIDGDDTVKQFYKSTLRKRRLLMLIWGVLSFVIPKLLGYSAFNGIAGVLPLLFPTFTIRAVGIKDALKGAFGKKKGDEQTRWK